MAALLVSMIVLKGYKFVNPNLKVNYSLQAQVVVYTLSRFVKSLFSRVFEQKGFISVTANASKYHCNKLSNLI